MKPRKAVHWIPGGRFPVACGQYHPGQANEANHAKVTCRRCLQAVRRAGSHAQELSQSLAPLPFPPPGGPSESFRRRAPISRPSPSIPKDDRPTLALAHSAAGEERGSQPPTTLSKATQRAYQADWKAFETWCRSRALLALPAGPETVVRYVHARAKKSIRLSTLSRALVAIGRTHVNAGHPSPSKSDAVRRVIQGLRHTLGPPPIRKAPVLVADLRALASALPASLLGTRDRALLLLGFTGAFRGVDLVALEVPDLVFTTNGITVTLLPSQSRVGAHGRKVGIPYGRNPPTCPVRAVRAWLEASKLEAGPLFRQITRWGKVSADALTPQVVALVVKRAATAAGLNASRFAGHSLRAGLVVNAARAGKSEGAILRQAGYRSVQSVRRQVRDHALYTDNAAEGLGL